MGVDASLNRMKPKRHVPMAPNHTLNLRASRDINSGGLLLSVSKQASTWRRVSRRKSKTRRHAGQWSTVTIVTVARHCCLFPKQCLATFSTNLEFHQRLLPRPHKLFPIQDSIKTEDDGNIKADSAGHLSKFCQTLIIRHHRLLHHLLDRTFLFCSLGHFGANMLRHMP